jgi:DNA-binding NtrC family response regulator
VAGALSAAVLVVAADDAFVSSIVPILERQNLRTLSVTGAAPAIDALLTESPVLVIVGQVEGGAPASLRLAARLRQESERCLVVLAPRESSEELAIAALRAGCADYLRPPIGDGQIEACVARCLAQRPGASRTHTPNGRCHDPFADRLVSCSESMQAMKRFIVKVAPSDANVLITGETGTGKELVARLIHDLSPRRERPFSCVNCAALPDALFESEIFGYESGAFTGAVRAHPGRLQLAEGGTFVLDEIGEMSPFAQAKLLRAIEAREVLPLGGRRAKPVDVRIVASTNQDPETLIDEKRFRSDLFFRLNVARIHLPPLRERKEDVLVLFLHHLAEFNRRYSANVTRVTPEASDCLLRYDWPGNVRELRNVVEGIFIDPPAKEVAIHHLPGHLRGLAAPANALDRERERMIAALTATHWNKSEAAKQLQWSRMTLYRKLSKHHLAQSAPLPGPVPLGKAPAARRPLS